MILAQPTSPSYALKAAKQLVGCFPHARPPEPETYAGALGATLAQYPQAIVAECVDPRVGLVRKLRFPPTVAEIVEWCDERRRHYDALARYEPRPQRPEREFTDADRALASQFLADLAIELESRKAKRAPGLPTTMGDHLRKAIEERPRAGLTPESRMRKAEALGRKADKLSAEQNA